MLRIATVILLNSSIVEELACSVKTIVRQ